MHDVRMIKAMLEEAGRLAMHYFLKVTPSWKANRTYVTDADLAVQAFLKKELDTYFPEDGIVAEENDLRKESAEGGRTWIIDPIDGTASFVAGFASWGLSIGLVEGYQPVAGFFSMPASGDLFHTTAEGTVYRNDHPVSLREPAPFHRESLVLTHTRFHSRYTMAPAYPGKVFCLGSAAAHLCSVATGGADVAFLDDVHVWDFAAGWPLVLNNGGVLRYLQGGAVTLTDVLLRGDHPPTSILGGHADMVAHLEPFIARIGS